MTLPPGELGEREAFRTLLAGQPGAHVREVGGALCTAFPELRGSALFNRALGTGLAEPATDAGLDEIDGFFGGLGVDYAITLTPDARPPGLARKLERRGFTRGYAWTKFERGVEAAPASPTELRVERAAPALAAPFADVFARAYGTPELVRPLVERLPSLPGWHCFLAFAGDTPAGTGALYVAGDVGWLGVAGTLPELRGRGAQGAILSARIEAARDAGCRVLVTETGSPVGGRPGPSYRNIERAGFTPAYVRDNYLSAPDADTSGTTG